VYLRGEKDDGASDSVTEVDELEASELEDIPGFFA
jgi:hypothetical protein